MNWEEALKVIGESPGREEAVADALATTAEKKRVREAFEELKAKRKRRGR